MDSLQRAQQRLQEAHDGASVLRAAAQQLAPLETWKALPDRLKSVERQVGRRMRSGRGRPWELPTRQPAAQGCDQLVLALEAKAGLTSRKAKAVVNAFWKVIQAALRRGEIVKTPLGVLQVVFGPKPHKRQRWGKNQVLYRQRKKIVFRPGPDLLAACNPPHPKEVPVPDVNVPGGSLGRTPRGVPSQQLLCEKCGSSYFMEAEFRQYRKRPSSMPGGDLLTNSENDPIRMLVCMCGNPIQPGKQRRPLSISREEDANFQKSAEAARQYREVAHPQAIIGSLSQSFASKGAHDRLAGRIANLEGILWALALESLQPRDSPAPSAKP